MAITSEASQALILESEFKSQTKVAQVLNPNQLERTNFKSLKSTPPLPLISAGLGLGNGVMDGDGKLDANGLGNVVETAPY